MKIIYNSKLIKINPKKLSQFEMFLGLMFRSKNFSQNLLFEFPYSSRWRIHSFFVSTEFLAIWLDKNKKVLEFQKVKPWRISVRPKKPAKSLIEIPLTSSNYSITSKFLGSRRG